MRIIDSKGRLFGVANLLDLLVLAVVLALIGTGIVNFITKPRASKANVELAVKVLYRVPNEVARNPKILKTGDSILIGNAVVEKILDIRPVIEYGNRETAMSDMIILIKANCVMLNNEYYCANMPIKVNSSMTISNPLYVFSNGTILDVEASSK